MWKIKFLGPLPAHVFIQIANGFQFVAFALEGRRHGAPALSQTKYA
jgi:hypothetical protein